ncbi:MAG: hypothetical protein IT495_08190 [Gammaproteobacteria bacterium]|nr:hypothetical protein [Gammaproteobacteria bacterium]
MLETHAATLDYERGVRQFGGHLALKLSSAPLRYGLPESMNAVSDVSRNLRDALPALRHELLANLAVIRRHADPDPNADAK